MNIFDNAIYNLLRDNITTTDNITSYQNIISTLLNSLNELTDDSLNNIVSQLQSLNIDLSFITDDNVIEDADKLNNIIETNYNDIEPFKTKYDIKLNDNKYLFNNSNYILAYLTNNDFDNIDFSNIETMTPFTDEQMNTFVKTMNDVIQDHSIYNILQFIFNNGFNTVLYNKLRNTEDYQELLIPIKILDLLVKEKDNEELTTSSLKTVYNNILEYITGTTNITPTDFYKYISNNIGNIDNNLLTNIQDSTNIVDLYKDTEIKFNNKNVKLTEFLNDIIKQKKITVDENNNYKKIIQDAVINSLNDLNASSSLDELLKERDNTNIVLYLGSTTYDKISFNSTIEGMLKNQLGSTLLLMDKSKINEFFNKEISENNIAWGIVNDIFDDNELTSYLNVNKTLFYNYIFDVNEDMFMLDKVISNDKKEVKTFLTTIFKPDIDLKTSMEKFINIFKNNDPDKYPYLTLYYSIIYSNLINFNNNSNSTTNSNTTESIIYFRDRLYEIINEDDNQVQNTENNTKDNLNKRLELFKQLVDKNPNLSLTDIALNIWKSSNNQNTETENTDNTKLLELRNSETINLSFINENIKFTDIMEDMMEGKKGHDILLLTSKQLAKPINANTIVDGLANEILNKDKLKPYFKDNIKADDIKNLLLNNDSLINLLNNDVNKLIDELYTIFKKDDKPIIDLLKLFIDIFKNENGEYKYLSLYYTIRYSKKASGQNESLYFKGILFNIINEDVDITDEINNFNNMLKGKTEDLLDIVTDIWNQKNQSEQNNQNNSSEFNINPKTEEELNNVLTINDQDRNTIDLFNNNWKKFIQEKQYNTEKFLPANLLVDNWINMENTLLLIGNNLALGNRTEGFCLLNIENNINKGIVSSISYDYNKNIYENIINVFLNNKVLFYQFVYFDKTVDKNNKWLFDASQIPDYDDTVNIYTLSQNKDTQELNQLDQKQKEELFRTSNNVLTAAKNAASNKIIIK